MTWGVHQSNFTSVFLTSCQKASVSVSSEVFLRSILRIEWLQLQFLSFQIRKHVCAIVLLLVKKQPSYIACQRSNKKLNWENKIQIKGCLCSEFKALVCMTNGFLIPRAEEHPAQLFSSNGFSYLSWSKSKAAIDYLWLWIVWENQVFRWRAF